MAVFSLSPRVVAGLLVFGLSGAATAGRASERPILEADGDPQAGHVTLSWRVRTDAQVRPVFQLQEGATATFEAPRVRYEGAHTSSVVSGLPDGARFYRVRYREGGDAEWSAWSPSVRFEVQHYSLVLAGTLFGIGALVFAVTAWFVIKKGSH